MFAVDMLLSELTFHIRLRKVPSDSSDSSQVKHLGSESSTGILSLCVRCSRESALGVPAGCARRVGAGAALLQAEHRRAADHQAGQDQRDAARHSIRRRHGSACAKISGMRSTDVALCDGQTMQQQACCSIHAKHLCGRVSQVPMMDMSHHDRPHRLLHCRRLSIIGER